MNDTAQHIIDAATRMIRKGGYHSFSFRQIAEELGIKSASIHYHFPSKEALGIAVSEQYLERFMDALGEVSDHPDPIGAYVDSFLAAWESQQAACLCGTLASEVGEIPEPVQETLRQFATRNLDWLREAVRSARPHWPSEQVAAVATMVFSALEGAIAFAAVEGDSRLLQEVAAAVPLLVSESGGA